jgi:hypothetical protein
MMLQDAELDSFLLRAVQIDRDNLEDEYTRVAADYSYVGELYSRALEAHERARIKLDGVYAAVRGELHANAKALGHRVTERKLDVETNADPSVMQARERMAGCHGRKVFYKLKLEAIATKRDMLVSLGAHARQDKRSADYAT